MPLYSPSRNTTHGFFGATMNHLRNNGFGVPSGCRSLTRIVSVMRLSAVAAIALMKPSMNVPVGPVTPDLSSTARMIAFLHGRAI